MLDALLVIGIELLPRQPVCSQWMGNQMIALGMPYYRLKDMF